MNEMANFDLFVVLIPHVMNNLHLYSISSIASVVYDENIQHVLLKLVHEFKSHNTILLYFQCMLNLDMSL